MKRLILAVAVVSCVSAAALAQPALESLKLQAAVSTAEIPISAPVAVKKVDTTSTWTSLQLFTFKSGAQAFAKKVQAAFERAGIQVVNAASYSNFESTGFKNKALITYVGDASLVGRYKSPWYKTEAERDSALATVSAQLERSGYIVIDHLFYREGNLEGPMSHVVMVDYIKGHNRSF